MLTFEMPWLGLLLPLPYLVYRLVPAYKVRTSSMKVPFFQQLVSLSGRDAEEGAVMLKRVGIQRILLVFQWVMIVLALCKPVWLGEPVVQEMSGRDLMVAVDLSGSMSREDFKGENNEPVDRLVAAKSMLRDFVKDRKGDRLGLILFGDAAYLQAPFTEDHATWLQLLEETEIGMAGGLTKLGDAIGLAIKRFRAVERENRTLLVLTDGKDTGSSVPPIEAAKMASVYGINIYVVAMGDPYTLSGGLDLNTLEQVTELTDGKLYQAVSKEELAAASQDIGGLVPETYERATHRPQMPVHYYPIALVCLLYLGYLTHSQLRLRKRSLKTSSSNQGTANGT